MKEMDLDPGEQIKVSWNITFGYTESAVAVFKHYNPSKSAVWAEVELGEGKYYRVWERL